VGVGVGQMSRVDGHVSPGGAKSPQGHGLAKRWVGLAVDPRALVVASDVRFFPFETGLSRAAEQAATSPPFSQVEVMRASEVIGAGAGASRPRQLPCLSSMAPPSPNHRVAVGPCGIIIFWAVCSGVRFPLA